MGQGFCVQGCKTGAKWSTLYTEIPRAEATDPGLKVNFNPVTSTWQVIRFAAQSRAILNSLLGIGRLKPHAITPEAFSEYLRCFRDPATIHATCEDYRAAASIDLVHDDADMDRKVTCPVLALWGEKGVMHRMYDVVAVWRERAANVSGKALPCGHFLAEEAPEETLTELRNFLKD